MEEIQQMNHKRSACEDPAESSESIEKMARVEAIEEPTVSSPTTTREPLTPVNHSTNMAPRSSRSKLNFVAVQSIKKEPRDKESAIEETHAISFIDRICQATVVNETPDNSEKEEEEESKSQRFPKSIKVESSGYGRPSKAVKPTKSAKAAPPTAQLKKVKSFQGTKESKPKTSKAISTSKSDVESSAEDEVPSVSGEELLRECHSKSQLTELTSMLFAEEDTVEEVCSRKIKAAKYDLKLKNELGSKLISELKTVLKETTSRQKKFASEAIVIERDLINMNDQISEKYQKVSSECSELRNQIQNLNEEKYINERDLEATKTNYDEAVEKVILLESQIEDKMKQLEEVQHTNETMEKDLNNLLEKSEGLEEQNKALHAQMTANAEAHVKDMEVKRQELVSKYTAEIKELNDQLTKWAIQGSEQTNRIAELNQSHESLSENIKSLESKLNEKEQALATCSSQLNEATKSADILEVKLESAKSQLDGKTNELSMALASIGDIQKASSDRESQLRIAQKDAENSLNVSLAESTKLREDNAQLRNDNASMNKENESLKESLSKVSEELAVKRSENEQYQITFREQSEALAIEKELRARAESREEEERRERTATCAQLIAQTQAQNTAMATLRDECDTELKKAKQHAVDLQKEVDAAKDRVREANERVISAESETKQFRSMLEHERSNTEELVEMAHKNGEMEALRHRLQEQQSDYGKNLSDAQQEIRELKEELRAGESARRKLHNTIQELRGNVRVFARVRPFLPGDGANEDTTSAVVVRADKQSLAITNEKETGPEMHSFTFDKAFMPNEGQDMVFAEVSEFVQSALDGYNVCLFSYGQTGSGKTHTMQGSRHGQMRGIIPRAIEQVSAYKEVLEAQGWKFTMEITFIEIYNETIRDLLRSANTPSTNLEVRTLKDGSIGVPEVTRLEVDPSDEEKIETIMDLAARHRSVAETDMNAQSSRSHSIFTLHLKGANKELNSSITGALNLADLAGSERLDRSGAKGDRLKETQAINKSLSCLSEVFLAISNKNSHIPFRNSKLTHLLSPCLSGDGKTLMMVNLSPTEQSSFETLCSLRFASTVNKCELGKPKKHFKDLEGSGSKRAVEGGGSKKTESGAKKIRK